MSHSATKVCSVAKENNMRLILSVFSVLVLALSSAPAIEVLKLNARVNDYANIFSEAQRKDLEKQLVDEETATSNQIFILTVDSLQGLEMSDYAQKVFEVWKPGVKNKNETKNNGVLIVHDVKNRVVRIQTGYGMEGPLPDITAYQITKKMGIYFKRGEFYQGYKVGIAEIIEKVKDEYKPTVATTDSDNMPIIIVVILGILLLAVSVVVVISILSPEEESESMDVPEISSDDPIFRKVYPEGPARSSRLSRPQRKSENSRPSRSREDKGPSIPSGAFGSETSSSSTDWSSSDSSSSESSGSSDSVSGGGGESGGGGGESSY